MLTFQHSPTARSCTDAKLLDENELGAPRQNASYSMRKKKSSKRTGLCSACPAALVKSEWQVFPDSLSVMHFKAVNLKKLSTQKSGLHYHSKVLVSATMDKWSHRCKRTGLKSR